MAELVQYCRHRSHPPVSPKAKGKGCRSHIRLCGGARPSPDGLHRGRRGGLQGTPSETRAAPLPRVIFSLRPGSLAWGPGLCSWMSLDFPVRTFTRGHSPCAPPRLSPSAFSGPDASGRMTVFAGRAVTWNERENHKTHFYLQREGKGEK